MPYRKALSLKVANEDRCGAEAEGIEERPEETRMRDDTEPLFTMSDPDGKYSSSLICALLLEAERQGYPIEHGSYLEHMTIKQLDQLVHGKTQA
jgi:hypothetical protein